MNTLNSDQKRRNLVMHVCPLQLDIIERLINRFSNKGDLVADPFGGIGSTGFKAIKMGRKAHLTELNTGYFLDNYEYLKAAEMKYTSPTLFDMVGIEYE